MLLTRHLPIRALSLVLLATAVLLSGCSFEEEPRHNNMPVSQYIKTVTTSENDRRIDEAVEALIAIGEPAVPYMIKAWRDNPDTEIRCRLARALEPIGPGAMEAVPLLIEALDEIDERQVSCAAYALGGMGHAALPAKDRLAALLRSSDTATQVNLLYALGSIGADAADEIPLILEAVERGGTRAAAIDALSRMGEPAVEAITPWLEGGSEAQRLVACEVLANMGQDAALVLPALRTALRDENPRIRIEAAKALGSAGTFALPAHQALVYALRDENNEVRETVIASLIRIGPSGAKDLISALNARSWRSREGAARVIGQFSSLIEAAREELIRAMGDMNVDVRIAVTDALALLGPSVVEDMITQLNSSSVQRRWSAARVLGTIGTPAEEALPALRARLQDPDALVRNEARAAIESIANL